MLVSSLSVFGERGDSVRNLLLALKSIMGRTFLFLDYEYFLIKFIIIGMALLSLLSFKV